MNEKKKHESPGHETKIAMDDANADTRLALVRRLRSELEAMGLVRWTGEHLKSHKVYAAVPWDGMTTSARAADLAMMAESDDGQA